MAYFLNATQSSTQLGLVTVERVTGHFFTVKTLKNHPLTLSISLKEVYF